MIELVVSDFLSDKPGVWQDGICGDGIVSEGNHLNPTVNERFSRPFSITVSQAAFIGRVRLRGKLNLVICQNCGAAVRLARKCVVCIEQPASWLFAGACEAFVRPSGLGACVGWRLTQPSSSQCHFKGWRHVQHAKDEVSADNGGNHWSVPWRLPCEFQTDKTIRKANERACQTLTTTSVIAS